ncbi:MAG: TetR/AcrR family transcriptional regulator [Duodenibacillus sp.]
MTDTLSTSSAPEPGVIKRGRPRKTNRMGEGTIDNIAAAARTVLTRDGAGRFTLERVAAEAGITKGTLLYHFSNKEALLDLLMDKYIERLQSRLEKGAQAAREKNPDSKVDPTVAAFAEWYRVFRAEDMGSTNLGLALLTMAASDDALRGKLRAWYCRIFETLDKSAAGDDAYIAVLAMEGLFYLRHFHLDVPGDAAVERILAKLEGNAVTSVSADAQPETTDQR